MERDETKPTMEPLDETETPKKARDLARKALPNAVRTGIRAGDYCINAPRGRGWR